MFMKRFVSTITCLGLLAGSLLALAPRATASNGLLNETIWLSINPTSTTHMLTSSKTEVDTGATKYGYTQYDQRFLASTTSTGGFAAVNRYYNAKLGDFASESVAARQNDLIAKGYSFVKVSFYAASSKTSTNQPVYRYVKGSKHSYALSISDQKTLSSNGWTQDGVSFYAVPTVADAAEFTGTSTPTPTPTPTPTVPVNDGLFTIAVLPDTQKEALSFMGPLYNNQMNDILSRRNAMDIKFAISAGDVVNGGSNAADTTTEPGQYNRMTAAFQILNDNAMPYTIATGNHDTAAVCGGGGACVQYYSNGTRIPVNTLLRDTSVFNSRMSNRITTDGQYTAGHKENSFKLYEAEGAKWMVLSLELWPRQSVMNWAKQVVASHPTYNVIVVTHSLLVSDGSIDTTNGGYGNITSKSIYDQLILAYPNIKLALCGHKNGTTMRVDSGVGGNKVLTILTAFHSNDFNPTRFITLNVAGGSVASQIRHSSRTPGSTAADPNYQQYDKTVNGLSFIRS